MFFILSKLFHMGLSPFTWFLGLIALSFIVKKKKKVLHIIAFSILLFFSNRPIQNTFLRFYEAKPVKTSELTHYEYGIVLGGMSRYEPELNGTIFQKSVNRLTGALQLYKTGIIEKIVITGGVGRVFGNKEPEATRLKAFLLEMGFPEKDIIIESKSRNTAENAIFTAQLLPNALKSEQLLITSAFHIRRSQACFKKAGFNTLPYPTDFYITPVTLAPSDWLVPSAEVLSYWQLFIKEIVGLLVYKIRGYA